MMQTNSVLERLIGEFNLLKEELQNAEKILKKQNNSLLSLYKEVCDSEKQIAELGFCTDELFRVVSHDLRNPVASVVSYVRIIKRDLKTLSQEDLEELNVELSKAVNRISRLLENLVLYARIFSGKFIFKPEALQIKDLVEETIDYERSLLKDKNIKLVCDLEEGLNVFADRIMISTVLINLINNAIKYSRKNSEITVKLLKENSNCRISVIDCGLGISESDLENIFSVGMTRSRYGTEDEKGSGLGLPICKELMKINNGSILVEPNKPQGSVFHLLIPLL